MMKTVIAQGKVIYNTSDPDPEFPGGELDSPPSGWDLVRDEFYIRGVDGLEFAVYNSYDLEYYNVWAGNENVEINKFIYLLKSRYIGIAKINASNEIQYYIKDHLGSIRVTIDQNNGVLAAQDYDPWGYLLLERTYNQENTTYKFTGKQRDNETEYDYFGARYYDSRIGRWSSIDPLFEKHYNFNPYNYVLGNPLVLVDPDGRSPEGEPPGPMYMKPWNDVIGVIGGISIVYAMKAAIESLTDDNSTPTLDNNKSDNKKNKKKDDKDPNNPLSG